MPLTLWMSRQLRSRSIGWVERQMAVLFVSHSSKDDAAATALEVWLRANGFTDMFVDHQSLAGGDQWREELRASAGACRVVVCLVTENWLASNECFSEFRAAWYMGKRIIPLFLLPPAPNLGEEAKKRFAEVLRRGSGPRPRSLPQAGSGARSRSRPERREPPEGWTARSRRAQSRRPRSRGFRDRPQAASDAVSRPRLVRRR